jgi:hypothetical protein
MGPNSDVNRCACGHVAEWRDEGVEVVAGLTLGCVGAALGADAIVPTTVSFATEDGGLV